MTTPDGGFPTGTVTSGDLAPLDGLNQEDWRFNLNAQHITPWQGAQDAMHTAMNQVQSNYDNFRDGQLALNNRTELLKQVSGYGTVFLGQNWNIPNSAAVVLPFNRRLGPLKNTDVNNSDGILLKSKGLWRAEGHLTQTASVEYAYYTYVPTTLPGGIAILIPIRTPYFMPVSVRFRIEVIRQGDGALMSVKTYNQMPDPRMGETGITAPQSTAFNHTFVVDIDPNDSATWCLVRIAALAEPAPAIFGNEAGGAGFACKIHGGTALSSLTASRWSVDTSNYQLVIDAPDGGLL